MGSAPSLPFCPRLKALQLQLQLQLQLLDDPCWAVIGDRWTERSQVVTCLCMLFLCSMTPRIRTLSYVRWLSAKQPAQSLLVSRRSPYRRCAYAKGFFQHFALVGREGCLSFALHLFFKWDASVKEGLLFITGVTELSKSKSRKQNHDQLGSPSRGEAVYGH